MWGPGNDGIFNAPTGASPAETWTLVQELVVTEPLADIMFTNLRYYPMIRVEGFGLEFSSTTNLGLTVSDTNGRTQYDSSDYIRFGDTATPSGIVLTSSVVAGTLVAFDLEISNFNKPAISFFNLCGGQEGAASAGTVQSSRTSGDAATAELDAISLNVANDIVAGTIRIYQKGA